MTILLRELWEELLPREQTRWHWSKHVKFRPSWLFHKGFVSLHSCQTAILPHVGTLNSACWALSTFQSASIWALKISLGLALGGAFAMGTNTMALIQAFSVQAHHDCSTKGCLSLHRGQTAIFHKSYYCSSVLWEWAKATRCCKQPELFRDPPPPPVNKHNRFQYTVPSHIKVVRLIRAGRGSEAKKTIFL